MQLLHNPIDTALRENLRAYDDLTAALLARRGIHTPEEAEAFLAPSYDAHIGDPLLMLDMEKAARRIAEAIATKERIVVWSDYDCDGIPGAVILHDFFKKVGANFKNYIPHRHLEGYGVNVKGIEALANEGTTLIITVDSGITDVVPIARARELGIDVIVTDHHLPQGETDGGLPRAYAIVNPKQEGETYPFRDFCGAGLAWKLVCAVLAVGFPGREEIPVGWEKWLLDMAGLATIADMVPLLGENRVIAKYGLMVMRKSPRIGFQKLLKNARVNQRFITEDDVGFMIAPRVNAASRMGNPWDAFLLFTTEDENEADTLSKELEKINRSRRAVAGSITRVAHERLQKRKEEGTLPAVIALGDPEWRPGLLGIVANTLSQEYERPVFLWGREGGETLKGSCRSGTSSVSVVDLMTGAAEVFSGFGGHQASGGFTVRDEAIFFLEERLNRAYAALSHTNGSVSVYADAHLAPHEATDTLLQKLSVFAPFGIGNDRPVFLFQEVRVNKVVWFGKGEEHVKLTVTSNGFDELESVTFYAKRELGKKVTTLQEGSQVQLLASLERDQFTKGRPIRLRTLRIH